MQPLNRIEQTYRRLSASGKKILKLFSGNPVEQGFRFPSEVLEEAYGGYFRSQHYDPHPKGLPAARKAVAEYYGGQGTSVDPENILLTSGTSESFFYLFSLLARPGENLLAPHPSYPLFDHIAELAGVELRPYVLDEPKGWAVDLEDLRKKTDEKTRAILLISPNNPTGAVSSEDEIREIVQWADSRNMALICDEVFSEFYFGKGLYPRPMSLASPRLCFTLNGISKMFALPALKLGWIAVTGDRRLVDPAVDHLETMADTFLSCATPIQQALPLLFSKGQEFLEGYRKEVRRRAQAVVERLRQIPGIQFHPPQGGFYATARVQKNLPFSEEECVIRLMEEEGLFFHPGYFYDLEEGVHLVFSHLFEPEKMEEALKTLARFLQAL